MAHQAHNIPWTVLAANLKPFFTASPHETSNFILRFEAQQPKQLAFFVSKLVKNIADHTACERTKFADEYPPPSDPDEVLISDDIVRKITPALLHVRQQTYDSSPFFGREYRPPPLVATGQILCRHVGRPEDAFSCGCVLPASHRTATFFTHRVRQDDDWREEGVFLAQWKVNIIKTLLLHGDMEAVLRICAVDAGSDIATWQESRDAQIREERVGWESVFTLALDAYLTLNIAYAFPSTWDPASGRDPTRDYRNTKMYQGTVYSCTTKVHDTEVSALPHRQFFGVIAHELWLQPEQVFTADGLRTATVPFPVFMATRSQHISHPRRESNEHRVLPPGLRAINFVGRMLYIKGLPQELIHIILDYADLKPRGRLMSMPTNPLHQDNWPELVKYLGFCWELIVRCNVMAKALERDIVWQDEIMNILTTRLGTKGGRRWWRWVLQERDSGLPSYLFE